jgi:hypothetical protein
MIHPTNQRKSSQHMQRGSHCLTGKTNPALSQCRGRVALLTLTLSGLCLERQQRLVGPKVVSATSSTNSITLAPTTCYVDDWPRNGNFRANYVKRNRRREQLLHIFPLARRSARAQNRIALSNCWREGKIVMIVKGENPGSSGARR